MTSVNTRPNPIVSSQDGLATTAQAADYLQLQSQTLYKWACYESGPIRAVRVGRALRWRITDLQKLKNGQ